MIILLFSLLGVVCCIEVQQLFCAGLFLYPVLNETSFFLFPSWVLYLLVHFRKLFALFYEGGRLSYKLGVCSPTFIVCNL